MERLGKLIEILKLTPHRQPELVKEATHRILSRQIRSTKNFKEDVVACLALKHVIQILIQYCDSDDSAQRSLFNDHLNTVVLTFQYQCYETILQVFLEEITNNGSARTVTAALQRIPLIIANKQPIELGCDSQKLFKALIEVARRTGDESVIKALDAALVQIMPFAEHQVKKSRELHLLISSLVEVLLRNLQNESFQVKRLAATSISTICSNSSTISNITYAKLGAQLSQLMDGQAEGPSPNKFSGFCLCIRELRDFTEKRAETIAQMVVKQINSNTEDVSLIATGLETLRELFKFLVSQELLRMCASTIANTFLIVEVNGERLIRENTKIILMTNALACIAAIVKQEPTLLDQFEPIFHMRNHGDTAVRNQLLFIIGNYVAASWKSPRCIDHPISCDRIRKLWVDLRQVLNDDNSHPDTLKSCVIAINTCIGVLLESDHCLHIVEYHDFDNLIHLYLESSFKPFKVEVLSLFASLNYRTLFYLERCHWSKMKAHIAGSLTGSLQDRILNDVVIASLTDDQQKIRSAAATALIKIIPNLYITNMSNSLKNTFNRGTDPIVSLAQDLTNEHLITLQQADEHVIHSDCEDSSSAMSVGPHDRLCIRNDHRVLSSAIVQSYDSSYNQPLNCSVDATKNRHRLNITSNLMYIVSKLRQSIENSLAKGKTAMSSIVQTMYELSLVYPIHQYSTSWDCRASEYCECFTQLNFLLTYLENLTEPDVVVDDLEAYKNFLNMSHQLLYALCHESVLADYQHQRLQPFNKRLTDTRDGQWAELILRHSIIADLLKVSFSHLTKLICLMASIIEERNNPFSPSTSNKQAATNQLQKVPMFDSVMTHDTLVSNHILFRRLHKKLESSYKSSKKNVSQKDEKFYQILDLSLNNLAALLEFVAMNDLVEIVKELLEYLKTTSQVCEVSSLICVRQLLKGLFGVNSLAIYQVDPYDWFEDGSWSNSPTHLSSSENFNEPANGVYHHLVSNPYKIFSRYYSTKTTPTLDKDLANLNYEGRRALRVRRRIEHRVETLFDYNPNQLMSPRMRQIGDFLKTTITEFTPVVTDCMSQFSSRGFPRYQSEALHLMSYLLLLRVNYQKLNMAREFIQSLNKILDNCGDRVYAHRETGIETLVSYTFTFLTLLSYERGPSKPMFQIATVIQKLDDLRAKLSITAATDQETTTYVVPALRCLVEDLFIYRTKQFQSIPQPPGVVLNEANRIDSARSPSKEATFDALEAERETVAQKLLDVVENSKVYDLISALILESRNNTSEITYKKLSAKLLSVIPDMLTSRSLDLSDEHSLELTCLVTENISPEVFQPVNFIYATLLGTAKPKYNIQDRSIQDFHRWMSSVLISIHILITQVQEDEFLARLQDLMTSVNFVDYLLGIAQFCVAEVILQSSSSLDSFTNPKILFLTRQLSTYILYLTHMFQSGLFFQLSRVAIDFMKQETRSKFCHTGKSFIDLCEWARDPESSFSLEACERMFFNLRLTHPDITIFWCNVMLLLNTVDCNRDFWRDLLIYDCLHCKPVDCAKNLDELKLDDSDDLSTESTSNQISKDESRFKRSTHVNRPSSLNLSDISVSDLLRRSFIKRITDSEHRDKMMNRNVVETSEDDGQLTEREVAIGNTEQCLSPNIELARRGALCLVLDFVTLNMNDVKHITWLIIHHIKDIVRWSHESPITDFITAVHGNSASSGIFIQAMNSDPNIPTSISFVTRLLWTLERVHYTQYGSLVVFLVKKFLSSSSIVPLRSLARKIEDFACKTVQKLLDETNVNLNTTTDEVVNQLIPEDLDDMASMLDADLYPKLTNLLTQLRGFTERRSDIPIIDLHRPVEDSDDDSDQDELDKLHSKSNLIYLLAKNKCTARISDLVPAISITLDLIRQNEVTERLAKDPILVGSLVRAFYTLALTIIPPPRRLIRPKIWPREDGDGGEDQSAKSRPLTPSRPKLITDSAKLRQNDGPELLTVSDKSKPIDIVETTRTACLQALFLFENIDDLRTSQFESFDEMIIRISRLPLVNSFILTPPLLWRQAVWPQNFSGADESKTNFAMVTHEILIKDLGIMENFCDRLLRLGWISRRQFEEAWMTLLGVLSPPPQSNGDSRNSDFVSDFDKRSNLLISCKAITTITRLLSLTQRNIKGDPLSPEVYEVQNFDGRVMDLTKTIATNLSSFRKRSQDIYESLELERRSSLKSPDAHLKSPLTGDTRSPSFSRFLRLTAQKLRLNAILNVEIDMQDTLVVSENSDVTDEVDIESCIRLVLSIFKQRLKETSEIPSGPVLEPQVISLKAVKPHNRVRHEQMAPPLTAAISQSVLALSDMFSDFEQFAWMFEDFVQMFKTAERNDDEIQMQYLIVGLCKAASICCYEIPNELTTSASINHRDVMFEKCRQSIERCIKSDFTPLKSNALMGAYYMLEDSISIVASGAWELDHFRPLRLSRLTWILKLMPILLEKENFELLTKTTQVRKLLELLCEVVSESEIKNVKL